eukprot:TRINITY_DN3645_c0_g1_i1.p1 TRINITY_DN3645_c0_g1~~TRINITY_DN3645_c0_g1_i1.p1  ORF type:complete len:504 (+),score=25.64 TRINITY_DN3645_c0_g1_i1:957-2468(+)
MVNIFCECPYKLFVHKTDFHAGARIIMQGAVKKLSDSKYMESRKAEEKHRLSFENIEDEALAPFELQAYLKKLSKAEDFGYTHLIFSFSDHGSKEGIYLGKKEVPSGSSTPTGKTRAAKRLKKIVYKYEELLNDLKFITMKGCSIIVINEACHSSQLRKLLLESIPREKLCFICNTEIGYSWKLNLPPSYTSCMQGSILFAVFYNSLYTSIWSSCTFSDAFKKEAILLLQAFKDIINEVPISNKACMEDAIKLGNIHYFFSFYGIEMFDRILKTNACKPMLYTPLELIKPYTRRPKSAGKPSYLEEDSFGEIAYRFSVLAEKYGIAERHKGAEIFILAHETQKNEDTYERETGGLYMKKIIELEDEIFDMFGDMFDGGIPEVLAYYLWKHKKLAQPSQCHPISTPCTILRIQQFLSLQAIQFIFHCLNSESAYVRIQTFVSYFLRKRNGIHVLHVIENSDIFLSIYIRIYQNDFPYTQKSFAFQQIRIQQGVIFCLSEFIRSN